MGNQLNMYGKKMITLYKNPLLKITWGMIHNTLFENLRTKMHHHNHDALNSIEKQILDIALRLNQENPTQMFSHEMIFKMNHNNHKLQISNSKCEKTDILLILQQFGLFLYAEDKMAYHGYVKNLNDLGTLLMQHQLYYMYDYKVNKKDLTIGMDKPEYFMK